MSSPINKLYICSQLYSNMLVNLKTCVNTYTTQCFTSRSAVIFTDWEKSCTAVDVQRDDGDVGEMCLFAASRVG